MTTNTPTFCNPAQKYQKITFLYKNFNPEDQLYTHLQHDPEATDESKQEKNLKILLKKNF